MGLSRSRVWEQCSFPGPALLSAGSKGSEFWAPACRCGTRQLEFKGGRGLLHHPFPFVLTHPHPCPHSLCLSICRKWATCFHKVIPGPVWAAELIESTTQSKGKRERALSSEAFPGVEDQRDFLQRFLGNLPRYVTGTPWWPWLTGSWSPAGYIARCLSPNRRTPRPPAPHQFGIHRHMSDQVILVMLNTQVLKKDSIPTRCHWLSWILFSPIHVLPFMCKYPSLA